MTAFDNGSFWTE